jgi:ABC-2 type transport system permease protein
MNMPAIYYVARNEFYRVLIHPLIIVVVAIMLITTFIIVGGEHLDLKTLSIFEPIDVFIHAYYMNGYNPNFISYIIAAFLGVTAMAEERAKGTLNVLLSKPLYRKDVILGKFVGLSVFMLMFIIAMLSIMTFMLLYFYGEPQSITEFLLRITAYIVSLWLELSFVIAFTLLLGTVFKDMLVSMSVTVTFLSFEWFWRSASIGLIEIFITKFPITPRTLNQRIINPDNTLANLFYTSLPFDNWLNDAMPYIVLSLVLILVMLLIDCLVVTRSDDL